MYDLSHNSGRQRNGDGQQRCEYQQWNNNISIESKKCNWEYGMCGLSYSCNCSLCIRSIWLGKVHTAPQMHTHTHQTGEYHWCLRKRIDWKLRTKINFPTNDDAQTCRSPTTKITLTTTRRQRKK